MTAPLNEQTRKASRTDAFLVDATERAGGASGGVAESPGVAGEPRLLLRLEGAGLLMMATIAYAGPGVSWWFFAALFFAPDLSFLAYLAGPRVGAAVYNVAHTTIGPYVLGLLSLMFDLPILLAGALIWAAHIGFDRMLGYGLKYPIGFGFTHLGRIGQSYGTSHSSDAG